VPHAIRYLVTVRHAVLPIGALLVLGLGVYLFVEVRAQPAPAPPMMPATTIDHPARPLRPAEPAVQQAAVLGDAGATAPPRSSDRPARTPGAAPATRDPGGVPAPEPEIATSGPKLDAAMDEANKAYDRGDFEDAKALAGRLLARLPTNVRMLRIMVSASCIDGDSAVAQLHFAKLPPADQEQMRVRCARYGVAFADRP
jgi:hypothetical protein